MFITNKRHYVGYCCFWQGKVGINTVNNNPEKNKTET